jgi:phosphatidylinositol alpha 1,6-mannosyltransferase
MATQLRPLRVALVTETFDPRLTGTAGTVRHVADRLVAAGHQVRILTGGAGPASYHAVAVDRFAPPRRNRRLDESLHAFGPDLVHAFTPGVVGAKALHQARRRGVPTLVTETSPRAEFAPAHWRGRVADRADRLVVTASWLRDRLAAADLPAGLWHPGVDAGCFAPKRRDERLHTEWVGDVPGSVVVGYVGSLRKRHGVRLLAEVARVPGIRLVVVGDGPQQAWLRSRLPESVRFTGGLKPREAATAIASLDVLVQPAPRATCCHVLREAAACGVPVIAPRAGGAVDVVRHLETGLLYDPTHRLALADTVAAVAADPQRRLLGDFGRQVALGRSWPDAVDELVREHYAPLLGAPVLLAG